MNKFTIRLNGVRFYSRIGVAEQERTVGNEYTVSVTIRYDAGQFKREDLSSTISYAEVYEVVKDKMSEERLLLETVAKDIADEISSRWSEAEEITVGIDKTAPPVAGIVGSCGVEYFWKKVKK